MTRKAAAKNQKIQFCEPSGRPRATMVWIEKVSSPPSAEMTAAAIAPTSIRSEPIRVKTIILSVAD